MGTKFSKTALVSPPYCIDLWSRRRQGPSWVSIRVEEYVYKSKSINNKTTHELHLVFGVGNQATNQDASAGALSPAEAFDFGQHLHASLHSHAASHAQVASASAQVSLQASHGSDIFENLGFGSFR